MLGAQPMLGCSEVLVQVSHLLCDFEDMLLEGTDLLEGFQAHRHLAPESCALAVACLVSLKSFHAGNETAREGEGSVIKTTLANPRRQIESTISTSQQLAGRKSLAKQLHHRVVGNVEEQLCQGEKLASVFLSDLDEPLRHRVRRAHLMVVIEAVIENHAPHDHLLICAYTRLRDPHVVYTALRRGFGSLAQFAKPGWDIFWGYRYHLQLAHKAICVEAYGKARVMAVARHVVELVGIHRTADDTGEVARRKMTSRSDNTGGQPHGQFRLISWKSEFFMHQHPLHAGAQDEKYGDAFGDGNRTNSLERGTDLVTQILQLVAVSLLNYGLDGMAERAVPQIMQQRGEAHDVAVSRLDVRDCRIRLRSELTPMPRIAGEPIQHPLGRLINAPSVLSTIMPGAWIDVVR